MAMSRSEIEVLLKMRAQGAESLDLFSGQLSKTSNQASGAGQALGQTEAATKSAGVAAGAAGVAFGLLADRVARSLVGGFRDTITEANKLDSALIGLSSVATAFGSDAGKAQEAAKRLAADGLMSVGDAALGLKNLLAAGFGLDQAVVLMNRFKDSAAFGRQASLDFGYAVTSATEGIKNGNSILVDNAGVTKNLSIILEEAGYAATDLSKATTDAGIRQALFAGLVKETNAQVGDSVKYLKTGAGAQAVFAAEVRTTYQAIGKELQPVLKSTLDLMAPAVRVIGSNADAFVGLTGAVAAVVLPMAAAKAAAALGLTPALASLTQQTIALTGAITVGGGLKSFGDYRAAIQLTGDATGITYAQLGKLGSTVAIASTFIAAWSVGRLIGEWTGWTKAIEDWASVTGRAAAANETQGAKQDTINKAIRAGAAATISYTDAIKYNQQIEDIRLAQYNKSAAAQLKRVDAELALGRITVEQANSQRLQLQVEQQAAEVRTNRARLADILAAKESSYRKEIEATGYTERELIGILQKSKEGFDAWAKQVHLSDDTISRLKSKLQGVKKDTSEAERAAQQYADAMGELNSAGAGVEGTLAGINGAVVEAVKYYLQAEVSQAALAKVYGLTDTEVRAIAQSLSDETAAHKKAEEAAKKQADALEEMRSAGDGWRGTLDGLSGAVVEAIKYYLDAGVSQEALAEAYGLTSTQIRAVASALSEEQKAREVTNDSIHETADLWLEYYGIVRQESMSAADQQILDVHRWAEDQIAKLKENDANWQNHYDAILALSEAKIDQIIKANDPLYQAWRKLTLEDLPGALSEGFASMLTGAKGFRDGFVGIWDSIKSSLRQILNDILNYFLTNFIGGLLKGSTSLSGILGGAGGGFGGGGLNLGQLIGGLFGGRGGGAGAGGSYIGGAVSGVSDSIFGGAAAGMGPDFVGPMLPGKGGFGGLSSGARFGGGALMIGSGVLQFLQGGRLNRTLGGAQTGAGIGTMIAPGIGTAIGAGVGALAGLVSSLFGVSEKEKQGRGAGDAIKAELKSILTDQQKLEAGGEAWKEQVIAVRDAYKATGRDENQALRDVQALWEAEKKGPEAVLEVWKRIAPAIEEAKKKQADEQAASAEAAAQKTKQLEVFASKLKDLYQQRDSLTESIAGEAPEAVMGVVEQNTRAQIDQINKQIADVSQQMQEASVSAAKEAGSQSEEAAAKVTSEIDRMLEALGVGAEDLRRRIMDALGNLHLDVGYSYRREGSDPGPGGGYDGSGINAGRDIVDGREVGGAASGIYTSRPTLAVFGEGGEPELGGPVSFMAKALAGAIGRSGAPAAAPVFAPTFQISGFSGGREQIDDLAAAVMARFVDWWKYNTNSARTNTLDALEI